MLRVATTAAPKGLARDLRGADLSGANLHGAALAGRPANWQAVMPLAAAREPEITDLASCLNAMGAENLLAWTSSHEA